MLRRAKARVQCRRRFIRDKVDLDQGRASTIERKYPANRREDTPMSQAHDENEPIPLMQQLLDNPFLLLFLGVLIPMLVYNVWGVVEIMMLPLGK